MSTRSLSPSRAQGIKLKDLCGLHHTKIEGSAITVTWTKTDESLGSASLDAPTKVVVSDRVLPKIIACHQGMEGGFTADNCHLLQRSGARWHVHNYRGCLATLTAEVKQEISTRLQLKDPKALHASVQLEPT